MAQFFPWVIYDNAAKSFESIFKKETPIKDVFSKNLRFDLLQWKMTRKQELLKRAYSITLSYLIALSPMKCTTYVKLHIKYVKNAKKLNFFQKIKSRNGTAIR